MLDHLQLKAELARRGLREWRLAKMLGYAPTALSDWLRGVRRAPPDLEERIEQALGLRPKSLHAARTAEENP
jgi:predicted transcriptional regulator